MSKNTDKKAVEKVTKATIQKHLDSVAVSVAVSVAEQDVSQKHKLLSLIGGVTHYEAATDAEKRKLLDLCTAAINERIAALKTETKAIAKEERKPLKESPLWQGLRALLGNSCAMRSRLRTDAEKESDKKKAEKAKKEREQEIIKAAIQSGKVTVPSDDIPNVKTCTSLEEGVLALIDIAQKCKVSLASLQDMIARRY